MEKFTSAEKFPSAPRSCSYCPTIPNRTFSSSRWQISSACVKQKLSKSCVLGESGRKVKATICSPASRYQGTVSPSHPGPEEQRRPGTMPSHFPFP